MSDFWEGVGQLFKGWLEKPNVSNHSVSDAQKQLEANYHKTKEAFENSYIATQQTYDFATTIVSRTINETSDKAGVDFWELPEEIITLMMDVTVYAIKQESFFDFKEIDFSREIPLSRQIELKQYLAQEQLRIYADDEVLLCFHTSFWNVLEHFMLSIKALVHAESKPNSFNLDITYALESLPHNLEQMLISFFSQKNGEYGIFNTICRQLLNNADTASGFKAHRTERERELKPCTLPEKSKLESSELIKEYVGNTYLEQLFDAKIDFSIPIELRMEHCHILAGTGHGKTQLLQKFILDDLNAGRGFMVIDSQGDMISKIQNLYIFDPEAYENLSDQLIIIDPEDVDYPASLNMFSLDSGEETNSNFQKQMLINSTVDLYEYMFGALFGSELTSKQGIIFRYVAKLMAEIPNATIHTLRELLQNGKQFQLYIDKLDGSSKAFFDTQFFNSGFGQTKQQILSRLWAVLANQTLENLFSSKKNSVNIFEAIQENKIVLVNTSQKLLQSSGAQLLGRFFIALVAQAVIKRGSIPENQRNPFMVYVDEAQEYFDEKIDQMLNQARKQKVGFTLAHQNINQLGSLKGSMFSSTSVKLAGGISAKDAVDMKHEMKTTSDFLMSMKKTQHTAEFACYLKNHLNGAIPLSYKFGLLEQCDTMSSTSHGLLINQMRKRYCSHVSELSFTSIDAKTNAQPSPVSDDKQPHHDDTNVQISAKEQVKDAPSSIKTPEQQPPSNDELIQPVQDNGGKDDTSQQHAVKSSIKAESVDTEILDVPPEGKGGSTHRYLQSLVKKMGQKRGFHTVVESPVLDGHGSVDIALEGFGTKIAVEVSVHTQGRWESSNIAKCLSAGYDTVIILASEKEHLDKIQSNVSAEFLPHIKSNKLRFYLSDELITFLDKTKANAATAESNVSGYKITSSFVVFDENETKIREEALAKVLLNR